MIQYILRRVLVLPVVLFLVSLILFAFILQMPPEKRVLVYIPSVRPNMTPEQFDELIQITIQRYGLDRPLWQQYTDWVTGLARGDWGYSPAWRQPVLSGILKRAPATIELTVFALVPAVLLAIAMGSLAARHSNRFIDHVVRASTAVGWALPPFILGLLLMNVFYAWLGWFPPERISIWARPIVASETFRAYTGFLTVDAILNGRPLVLWDTVRHLVLPGITLALTEWALLTRIMRSSLLEVLRQDYVTTARAKGLREREVIRRHAQRNALLPLVSAGGVITSLLITGVVVVEVLFSFNGLGRWAVGAILQADVPAAVGFALFCCGAVMLASLISDILYAVIDPRVRLY